jgi:hypothetical protein
MVILTRLSKTHDEQRKTPPVITASTHARWVEAWRNLLWLISQKDQPYHEPSQRSLLGRDHKKTQVPGQAPGFMSCLFVRLAIENVGENRSAIPRARIAKPSLEGQDSVDTEGGFLVTELSPVPTNFRTEDQVGIVTVIDTQG